MTPTSCRLAREVIDQLYAVAAADTRIMVCDWLAYATRAVYRMANEITGKFYVPTLDECFDGSAATPEMMENPKWSILEYWHDYHWKRSTSPSGEAAYAPFFAITSIHLPSVTLGI